MFHESDKEVNMTCKFELLHRFCTPKMVFSYLKARFSPRMGSILCVSETMQTLCKREFEHVLKRLVEAMEDSRRCENPSAVIVFPPPRGCNGRASRNQQSLDPHGSPPPRDSDNAVTAGPCGRMTRAEVTLQKAAAPSRSAASMRPPPPCSSARKRESKSAQKPQT